MLNGGYELPNRHTYASALIATMPPRILLYKQLKLSNWYYKTTVAEADDSEKCMMENSSLPSVVWNDVTTSLSGNVSPNIIPVHELALKIVYVIIGIVGVLDNLFVIVIFIFFLKIADKVLPCIVTIYYACIYNYSDVKFYEFFGVKYF